MKHIFKYVLIYTCIAGLSMQIASPAQQQQNDQGDTLLAECIYTTMWLYFLYESVEYLITPDQATRLAASNATALIGNGTQSCCVAIPGSHSSGVPMATCATHPVHAVATTVATGSHTSGVGATGVTYATAHLAHHVGWGAKILASLGKVGAFAKAALAAGGALLTPIGAISVGGALVLGGIGMAPVLSPDSGPRIEVVARPPGKRVAGGNPVEDLRVQGLMDEVVFDMRCHARSSEEAIYQVQTRVFMVPEVDDYVYVRLLFIDGETQQDAGLQFLRMPMEDFVTYAEDLFTVLELIAQAAVDILATISIENVLALQG